MRRNPRWDNVVYAPEKVRAWVDAHAELLHGMGVVDVEDTLGCGTWGCVLLTSDEDWVVKVTTDHHEFEAVQLIEKLRSTSPDLDLDGIVDIRDIIEDSTNGIFVIEKGRLRGPKYTVEFMSAIDELQQAVYLALPAMKVGPVRVGRKVGMDVLSNVARRLTEDEPLLRDICLTVVDLAARGIIVDDISWDNVGRRDDGMHVLHDFHLVEVKLNPGGRQKRGYLTRERAKDGYTYRHPDIIGSCTVRKTRSGKWWASGWYSPSRGAPHEELVRDADTYRSADEAAWEWFEAANVLEARGR